MKQTPYKYTMTHGGSWFVATSLVGLGRTTSWGMLCSSAAEVGLLHTIGKPTGWPMWPYRQVQVWLPWASGDPTGEHR